MGRAPCCSKVGLHRGPWTSREDAMLTSYICTHGEGHWSSLPKKAGLLRCGKSCRLRWMNYLRPDIKRGNIGPEEEDLIIRLHRLLGNRWSLIAGRLPGRTDNEIKNYWNSHLSKKLKKQGFVLRESAPKRRQTKASSHGKKQSSSSSHEITKVYAPKPTRLAARVALESDSEREKGPSDQEESGSDMINHETELSADDWADVGTGDLHGFWDANYMFFDHLGFNGQIPPAQQEAAMLERLYDEYSQLLQPEVDMNLFDHHDHHFVMV